MDNPPTSDHRSATIPAIIKMVPIVTANKEISLIPSTEWRCRNLDLLVQNYSPFVHQQQRGRVIAKSMGLILKALCGNGLGQFRFSVFFYG